MYDCLSLCLCERLWVTYEEGTKQRKCPMMPSGWHWSLRPPRMSLALVLSVDCLLLELQQKLWQTVPTADLYKTSLKKLLPWFYCSPILGGLCHSAQIFQGFKQLQVLKHSHLIKTLIITIKTIKINYKKPHSCLKVPYVTFYSN